MISHLATAAKLAIAFHFKLWKVTVMRLVVSWHCCYFCWARNLINGAGVLRWSMESFGRKGGAGNLLDGIIHVGRALTLLEDLRQA
jgi:hypothetical protein